MRLEHASKFKYLGCVLDESGTYESECLRKVANGRRVAVTIRYLVNAKGLQLECLTRDIVRTYLMYGSETMLWKENEMSRIRAVQMDNLRGLLGIRIMHKVSNARIRELEVVTKGLMKVYLDCLAMWREWRMTGLLRWSM